MVRLKQIFNNNFAKNIMMIASGTAFAQILTIVMSPIITRIYPPAEFGVLSVYLSLLTILSIGASLDYQKAVPLAKDDDSAYNVMGLSFLTLIVFTTIITFILILNGDVIIGQWIDQSLVSYMYLIPIGVLLIGSYSIVSHWALRIKDFRMITRTKITQSIASNVSKVVFGLIGFGAGGLIFGQIIGQSGGILRLSAPLIDKKKEIIRAIKLSEIKRMAKRYVQFPLYSSPSNYIYTAGTQAPVIVLGSMFGTSVAGLYGLANSIVNLPISLLAMSVSQVFYSEIASIGKEQPDKIRKLTLNLSKKLTLIGLAPLLVFILFGPWMFSLVFGQNWYEAGIYAQILAFVAYAHFIILPSGRILEVIEKQYIGLIMNIIRLIFIIGAFIVASLLELSPLKTMIIYSTVSVISYLILFVLIQIVLLKESKLK